MWQDKEGRVSFWRVLRGYEQKDVAVTSGHFHGALCAPLKSSDSSEEGFRPNRSLAPNSRLEKEERNSKPTLSCFSVTVKQEVDIYNILLHCLLLLLFVVVAVIV